MCKEWDKTVATVLCSWLLVRGPMGIKVTRIFFPAVATKDRAYTYKVLHNTTLSDTTQPIIETEILLESAGLNYR
jgi:hypothetical protein